MKTLRLFYLLPILALFMAVTVGCNDDDDDPEPEQMETRGTVNASFIVRQGAITVAIEEWDVEASLFTFDNNLFLDRDVSSGSVSFNNVDPGSYYVSVSGEVTDTDGFTFTVSGFTENFIVVEGETNNVQVELN